MSILAVSNLYKTFQGTIALRDVSFSMNEQETLSIIGPSGSGKSTLLRMIMNLEKPDAGAIHLFDTVIDWKSKKNHELLYQQVGFIFQEFNLFDHLSVEANIQLAMRLVQKKPIQDQQAKTTELLNLLGLADKQNQYPNQLSGGQKQRVAIMRALALEPKLLLLDEPTSALDVESIQGLVEVLNTLQKKGLSILIVTHDIEFAKKVSSRLLLMENAQISYEVKTEDIPSITDEHWLKFLKKN